MIRPLSKRGGPAPWEAFDSISWENVGRTVVITIALNGVGKHVYNNGAQVVALCGTRASGNGTRAHSCWHTDWLEWYLKPTGLVFRILGMKTHKRLQLRQSTFGTVDVSKTGEAVRTRWCLTSSRCTLMLTLTYAHAQLTFAGTPAPPPPASYRTLTQPNQLRTAQARRATGPRSDHASEGR